LNEALENYHKILNAISRKQFSADRTKLLLRSATVISLVWGNFLSPSAITIDTSRSENPYSAFLIRQTTRRVRGIQLFPLNGRHI
jgi:hypothetical protein